jgi:hypothetical protein
MLTGNDDKLELLDNPDKLPLLEKDLEKYFEIEQDDMTGNFIGRLHFMTNKHIEEIPLLH